MSIETPRRRILVSGASIAGPALAYWLARYGFAVTIVERAPMVRQGGYPIDIRGAAMVAARRMGLGAALAAAHIGTRRLSFLSGQGEVVARLSPDTVTGSVTGSDVELPRGVLANLLFDLIRDSVDFRFSDSINSIEQGPDHVDVTFESGAADRFDLVIGADGLHSRTRKLVFGPETQFTREIGYSFAGFSMPNSFGLDHEGEVWNAPGRMATLYAAGGQDYVHALLAFSHQGVVRDEAEQRRLTEAAFAADGWQIPNMLAALRQAEDLYFDAIQQIIMPTWHQGRVVLVGDAAFGPSFLTGQGTSLALAGAYVLASEIALHAGAPAAFAAYERRYRPFVALNQATVQDGAMMMVPRSEEELAGRNAALAAMAGAPPAPQGSAVRDDLDLSDYDRLTSLPI